MMTRSVALVLLCSWSSVALTLHADDQSRGNPIRKVVLILQDMQKEISAEGEKEKDLFEKFMCYCNGNTDGMSKSAEDASQKITELQSKLEAEKAEKKQLDQDLVQHKQDRAAAKADLATATSIREKEHSDFAAATGDQKTNVDALTGAIAALEKGMGAKAFLQAGSERIVALRKITQASSLDDFDRSNMLAFLQGQNPNGDYGSQSGEIVGVLKAMKDEMDKDLGGAIADEESAQTSFEGTSAAKASEIAAASSAIESKTERSGALAVAVVTTANDVDDTTAEMNDTQAFLANLKSQCETKKAEWAERSQLRAEEVKAISEVIAILNDDDALDIFKKTLSLSQGKMAFLQRRSGSSLARRARQILAKSGVRSTQLELLQFSLKAKSVDFSKVLKQIDQMAAILTEEQKDDDTQMAFCEGELEKSAQDKADTESAIESSAALIQETTSASEQLTAEIATLQADIKALDKAVADATEQRKNEHGEFVQFQTENNAAVQLIEKAKNRLFKLYRPNLYKEAPEQQLTDEEKILVASGRGDLVATTAAPGMIAGTNIQQMAFVQLKARKSAPAPPPETWGAYQKKGNKSNGVIALVENLLKELQDGITESKHDEATAQADYERLMSESQATRAENAKSITSKEAAKADLDVKLEDTKEAKASQETSLVDLDGYISQLHGKCDFLVQNFDARKAARKAEQESLQNAKAVLSGADFSM